MLPKKSRADTKEVEAVFKNGKFLNSPDLTFKFVLSSDPLPPRISFVAPKSISKKATERNLLRRRGYSALKKYIKLFPAGTIGVFIFKKHQEDVLKLENEIKDILNKIH